MIIVPPFLSCCILVCDMKKVYFVRHGESDGNRGLTHPINDSSLTDTGRSQAAFVAERCAKLPIEIIVCSTMNRTKETADIIFGTCPKPIEYSDLFRERRRPSEIFGKSNFLNEIVCIKY